MMGTGVVAAFGARRHEGQPVNGSPDALMGTGIIAPFGARPREPQRDTPDPLMGTINFAQQHTSASVTGTGTVALVGGSTSQPTDVSSRPLRVVDPLARLRQKQREPNRPKEVALENPNFPALRPGMVIRGKTIFHGSEPLGDRGFTADDYQPATNKGRAPIVRTANYGNNIEGGHLCRDRHMVDGVVRLPYGQKGLWETRRASREGKLVEAERAVERNEYYQRGQERREAEVGAEARSKA
uniref:Uncharacterized protein n=1 Tax=Noctiluca scintillans TaxID=2966 RepID=A0A7S0ZZR1_NOCSC